MLGEPDDRHTRSPEALTPASRGRAGPGPAGEFRHGELLRAKIRFAAPLLTTTIDAFWDHPELPRLFPEFLQAIHGSVRATVPLMEAARDVASRLAETDAVAAALPAYLDRHIEEERDHDEWLLRDLEAIGLPRESVLARTPEPTVAALAGAQYYWIFHAHPVALLGFFAVLEDHPPTSPHLRWVQQRTGLPAEAFRMLREHAELDGEHADDLFALIDTLPLAPRHAELLGVSALHTLAAVEDLYAGLLARSRGPSRPSSTFGRASP